MAFSQTLTPAFGIKMAFEDKAKHKDTITIGYDPLATNGLDTAFGESHGIIHSFQIAVVMRIVLLCITVPLLNLPFRVFNLQTPYYYAYIAGKNGYRSNLFSNVLASGVGITSNTVYTFEPASGIYSMVHGSVSKTKRYCRKGCISCGYKVKTANRVCIR